jgi:hypothetical protein
MVILKLARGDGLHPDEEDGYIPLQIVQFSPDFVDTRF